MSHQVTVVLPPVSEDQIAEDLRWLTRLLVENRFVPDRIGGVLGGEYGYGTQFTNDVFEMNPFYWGDCECGQEQAETAWFETHDHAPECYQQVLRARGFLDYDDPRYEEMTSTDRRAHNDRIVAAVCAEMGLDPEFGCYAHCTCTHHTDHAAWAEAHPHDPACGIVAPNFRHKPSGSVITWYKYIGRGMEVALRAPWREILDECVASLSSTDPTPQ